MNSARVAVVGAGLAGLNCAARLAELGFSPSIYEASDGIGGRARTDSVDGFRLDRGFQVLLTAYPEAQRTFDYASLGLGEFVPGAQVRQGDSFSVFADPTRVPRSALASLKLPVAGVADLWRLYRMKRDLATNDPRLDSGVFVCGDYRETPSIQGALVSGRKAAAAVAAAGDRTD